MKKLTTVLVTAAVALAALALLNTTGNLTTAAPKGQTPEPDFLVLTPTLIEEIGAECDDGGVPGNRVRYTATIGTAGWDQAFLYWTSVDENGVRSIASVGGFMGERAVSGDPWVPNSQSEVRGAERHIYKTYCNSLGTLELAVYLKK